jgi:alpha-mannosidase
MTQGLDPELRPWIETFRSRSCLDLQPRWCRRFPDGEWREALGEAWGLHYRPDWHARGLILWPRGGQPLQLTTTLVCPEPWRDQPPAVARLVLSWWAAEAELRVDGQPVHRGDLFDAACRWRLPQRWWSGEPLHLELELRSPLHDDGALIHSRIEAEPLDRRDPGGLLLATALELAALRQTAASPPLSLEAAEARARAVQAPPGGFQVSGHAHLDLAWLWPVADTWQAAERTFRSTLVLMERDPTLQFGHSTPALYAWLEQHRPALFAAIRARMREGRWEPLNGPWVETDAVLIGTASLLRQFEEGQSYSRATFPEWEHPLAWLPDSFGFGAGLPVVAAATGVRWFCTHKLAWNATNPFPHRLFRWRGRCGAEVLALMTAPIGTGGDPLAMERYRLEWQRATGDAEALWLPGVGDHGGGPTAEMYEQLALWQQQPAAAPQVHGGVRPYLARLEPCRAQLPVWRDELYLELHRACPTSRPDQKRHNRTLERLLREADLAAALLWADAADITAPEDDTLAADKQAGDTQAAGSARAGWRTLLFQQFHDILPGTSVAEVFEQAEPQWRRARRGARERRDRLLLAWLAGGTMADEAQPAGQPWWVMRLQPLPAAALTLRLPAGRWTLAQRPLPQQVASGGGCWVQLPPAAGLTPQALTRRSAAAAAPAATPQEVAVQAPVWSEPLAAGRWRISNGLLAAELGAGGLEQLWGADGQPQLAAPLQWRRWHDSGEFWDAWDLAADHREHPLPLEWEPALELVEQGPLCVRLVARGRCGASPLRLDLRLLAGSPWLELVLRVHWRQRHELLQLEVPLQQRACRWAADTPAGVLERPAVPCTAREKARWEVPAIAWTCSQAERGGLAVLLDGPQGVSGTAERLGISLLRGPTWPDPGADNGLQRLRLALMPCADGWRQAAVPAAARAFRAPSWCRPATSPAVPPPALALGSAQLDPVAIAPEAEPGVVRLTVQNLSPCRQPLGLSAGWQVIGPAEPLLPPWALRHLRVRRVTPAQAQSS